MMLEMWFRTVTDREREVLAMVAAGHNNTAIAAPGLPDRRH
jgi:DNA-binding NarL/FixJ family response regulator